MRYDPAWLYGCPLLKMQSGAADAFLEKNEYLLLLCPGTVYSYVRTLETKFGFDEDVFTVVQEKLRHSS